MVESLYEMFGSATDRKRYNLRRSQLEVHADILRVVHDGAHLPTQIMYKANLSWAALQYGLSNLIGRGLLERTTLGERRKYQLTYKGANVLASFTQIMELLRAGNGVGDSHRPEQSGGADVVFQTFRPRAKTSREPDDQYIRDT